MTTELKTSITALIKLAMNTNTTANGLPIEEMVETISDMVDDAVGKAIIEGTNLLCICQ